jgi:hypothetical protein
MFEKHPGELVESFIELVAHSSTRPAEHRGNFRLREVLHHDAGDDGLGQLVKSLKASFDVMDKDHGVFHGDTLVAGDFRPEEFLAEHGRQLTDVDGSAEVSAEKGDGAIAVEPEITLWNEALGERGDGGDHGRLRFLRQGWAARGGASWATSSLQRPQWERVESLARKKRAPQSSQYLRSSLAISSGSVCIWFLRN